MLEERIMKDRLGIAAESHTIDLPAGRFHYVTWGDEHTELPAAVLLHGITSSAQSWVRVGPVLADRFRVYALDMRGHGESIKPAPGTYSLRHSADDVAEFIQALGLEQPLLVGHSWGGATAIVLASGAQSQQPAPDLSYIILEDPAHNIGSSKGSAEEQAATFIKDIGRPAAELRTEIQANSPGWTEADIEGKIDALQKVSREAVISVFADAAQHGELLPLLSAITAPTLLLRADPALGSTMDEAAWEQAIHYLPEHSWAVQLNGATHNIHRSQFDEFMRVVNDFLAQE